MTRMALVLALTNNVNLMLHMNLIKSKKFADMSYKFLFLELTLFYSIKNLDE